MIIRCERCEAAFNIDESRIKPDGSKVRCSQCRHVFVTRLPPPTAAQDAFDHELESYDEGADMTIAIPFPTPGSSESADFSTTFEPMHAAPAPPAPKPASGPLKKQAPKPASGPLKKYVPFQRKLIYFAAVIIGFIALIVLPAELYRPILELKKLIENARSLIAGTQAAFSQADMARMNDFALETLPDTSARYDELGTYYYLAFNMLLMEGDIPSESHVREKLGQPGDGFSYEKLLAVGVYWRQAFAADPGVFEIFQNAKSVLQNAKKNARESGFKIADIYIMVDTGRATGFFKNHIAFLLDGYSWWEEPSYAGEPFEIKPSNQRWREMSLAGRTGFMNSKVSDPDNWYLPHFARDEWGLWFGVWYTREVKGLYNTMTIDFDATSVKVLMMRIAQLVGGIMLTLVFMVFFITRWLSGLVTKPITELSRGAKEVASGNYDYEVPVLKEDEFGELTRHFNQMTQGQKERLNLLETLKKFLSEDLAEKAAESGIVIGGQKTDCTVMFTDFAGFSTITQHMSATESVNVLNAYFAALIPVIKKYGGFPDKYIGDAIVAIFGAPIQLEDHAERALACAIEMQWKMRKINQERRRQGKTIFEMRVGLNSGEVIAGAIGCDEKLEYTSIGETTNLANRMESICEIGHVMIADGTFQRIKDIFFREAHIAATPQRIKVKGYPEPVPTFKVYVDDLVVEKHNAAASVKDFYLYKEVDHQIKRSPDEVTNRTFTKIARFL